MELTLSLLKQSREGAKLWRRVVGAKFFWGKAKVRIFRQRDIFATNVHLVCARGALHPQQSLELDNSQEETR